MNTFSPLAALLFAAVLASDLRALAAPPPDVDAHVESGRAALTPLTFDALVLSDHPLTAARAEAANAHRRASRRFGPLDANPTVSVTPGARVAGIQAPGPEWAVAVGQEFSLGDQLDARRNALEAEGRVLRIEVDVERLERRLVAAHLWLDAWRLGGTLDLLGDEARLAEEALALAQQALARGAGTQADTLQIESWRSEIALRRLETEGALFDNAVALAAALGAPPPEPGDALGLPTAAGVLPAPPVPTPDVIASLGGRLPTSRLAALESELAAARARESAAARDLRLAVSVQADADAAGNTGVRVGLTAPLPPGREGGRGAAPRRGDGGGAPAGVAPRAALARPPALARGRARDPGQDAPGRREGGLPPRAAAEGGRGDSPRAPRRAAATPRAPDAPDDGPGGAGARGDRGVAPLASGREQGGRTMKTHRMSFPLLATAVAILAGASGCGGDDAPPSWDEPDDAPKASPVARKTARLEAPGPLDIGELPAIAVARSEDTATLASPCEGRLTSLPFSEGDRVGEGDVVATVECLEAGVLQAREAAQARSVSALERRARELRALRDDGLVEMQRVVEIERAALDARADLAETRALLDRAGLQGDAPRIMLTAPFPAVVTHVGASVGRLVDRVDDTLIVLARTETRRVEALALLPPPGDVSYALVRRSGERVDLQHVSTRPSTTDPDESDRSRLRIALSVASPEAAPLLVGERVRVVLRRTGDGCARVPVDAVQRRPADDSRSTFCVFAAAAPDACIPVTVEAAVGGHVLVCGGAALPAIGTEVLAALPSWTESTEAD